MRKLELDDIILEKDVYNNIGREIIKRWNTGEGSWLDFVESEYKKDSYYLEFNTIMKQSISSRVSLK